MLLLSSARCMLSPSRSDQRGGDGDHGGAAGGAGVAISARTDFMHSRPERGLAWRARLVAVPGSTAILPTGLILPAIVAALLVVTGWLGGHMVFRRRVAVSDAP
jgi:hypothetical protein